MQLRVSGAAGAVTHQRIFRSGCRAGVNLFLQLLKQAIFQLAIVIKGLDLIGHIDCKFFCQLLGMPGLQGRTVTALNY